jgi:hypothetical protein
MLPLRAMARKYRRSFQSNIRPRIFVETTRKLAAAAGRDPMIHLRKQSINWQISQGSGK